MYFTLQVIQRKVLEKATTQLIDVAKKVDGNDKKDDTIRKEICETFVRKYTHARLGGFIKGRQEQLVEGKGSRSKGGSGLRDKLYHSTNTKKRKK